LISTLLLALPPGHHKVTLELHSIWLEDGDGDDDYDGDDDNYVQYGKNKG
jgi:hypothetical protein